MAPREKSCEELNVHIRWQEPPPPVSRSARWARTAIDVRVRTPSTIQIGDEEAHEQDPEVQAALLCELAWHRGWLVTHIYSDRVSDARVKRPGLQTLMSDARRGQFDVLVVWRFDRIGSHVQVQATLPTTPYSSVQ